MRFLFDASAIINLIRKGDLRVLSEGCTLDLALYESLNALWKEHSLLKRMSRDLVAEYVDILLGIFEAIEVRTIAGLERRVLENAIRYDLTVYDSSYFTYAIENGLAMVTDDVKLAKRVKGSIEVLSTSDL
ncbi:MAG: type II toxin-antitoxin system VapC family toxin [Candidatus Korarchaeota archaeon]|nr:type II toxin-antitoxin system VapC family toxin [Candidatus Korarchaeota archaeon]